MNSFKVLCSNIGQSGGRTRKKMWSLIRDGDWQSKNNGYLEGGKS